MIQPLLTDEILQLNRVGPYTIYYIRVSEENSEDYFTIL